MMNKDELTNKKYSLNARVRLFQSIVGATLLYGCASWKLEQLIRRTERKMLRMVLGCPRRRSDGDELESWVDRIKRSTYEAETSLKKLNVQDWVEATNQRR